MAQSRRGCGCALAALAVVLAAGGYLGWRYVVAPYLEQQRRVAPPPASGEEVKVVVLDVGQGDSILILTPGGKTALVDAGEPGDGKRILEAMKRHGADHIDLLVATHAHADHIGAADEVIKAAPVGEVLYSGVPNTTKNYEDFLKAVDDKGLKLTRAEPGQVYELGGGARLLVLAPSEPFFKREDLRSGGNEPNANSVVARFEYGEFSMLLTGDAEAQTEDRLIRGGAHLAADVLKVGHHGSKYATSEEFLRRGEFKTAVISAGEANRYGHPSQDVLNRLRAAQVRVYRTDFQGEIVITTKGAEDGYQVKTGREPKPNEDLWAGREALRDDSARRGFIDFGDLPPAPKPSPDRARANTNRNANRNANRGR
ncbi:MAG TPA: ComEC/Rec2 family competence protein [Pyrinomonadaceae bacterium]|nr:ComEC/Rec2 family competence protein [Pyrinomonadaceae bacterium]